MTTKRTISAALATLALASGVFAYRAASRPDCPGKIVCPLTGEIICADKCPVQVTTVSVEVPARTTTVSVEVPARTTTVSVEAPAGTTTVAVEVPAGTTTVAVEVPACCRKKAH